jgi:16S rRNA processing protein RimM
VFVVIGKIRRPHGVDGEMIVDSYSDFPERFKPGTTILIGTDHAPYVIRARRFTNSAMLVMLRGIDTPEQAGELRNKMVEIDRNTLPPLPEGQYYHFQLVGLQVFGEDGKMVGVLNEVITTGANDVYVVVDEEGHENLFPALESVILSVDISNNKMVVRPQEWL